MSLPLSAAAPFFFNNATMRTPEFAQVETGVNFYIYALNDANDRIHRFRSFESVSNVMSPTNEKELEEGNWVGMSVDSDDRIYVIKRDGGIIRYDDWDDDDPDSKNDVPNFGWEGISVYNDELYLLDNTQKRIHRYSDWGDEDPESYAQLPTGEWQGINVDNDGRIYLLDILNKQIARYDRWEDIGTLQPDRKDTGLGALTYGLAIKNGTIYIIDQNNNRIWRYIKWESNNIEYRELPSGTWSGMATSGYEIGSWAGISVHTNEDDNQDNIYALNKANKQIARYESWESVKAGDPPDTKDIDDIEIDVKHTPVYFVDHTNEQIHKFYDDNLDVNRSETIELNAPNAYVVTGNQIDHYELLDNPTPDNTKSLPANTETIYTIDFDNSRLLRYNSLSDTNPDRKNLDNKFWHGVATNANGEIFVLGKLKNSPSNETFTISRYLSWDDTNPSTKPIPNGLWGDMSIDGNNIYLIDNQDEKIIRFTSWNNVSNTITSSQEKSIGESGAWIGISVNNGNIYILNNRETARGIHRYDDWDDTTLTEYKALRSTTNRQVTSLSVHTDSSGNGNIYVSGFQSIINMDRQYYIDKYISQTDTSPTSENTGILTQAIDVDVIATDYSGIGIDGDNKFYVVNNAANKILRLNNLNARTSPEYKIIPDGGWHGITIPPLTIGVTIANQDYIYLIDNGRNRIARYTSWEDSQPDYKNIGDGHWLGIAASGDNLYLLDNGLPGNRSRVVRYSSWNSTNPTENYLPANETGWEGISVDNRNRVYVLQIRSTTSQIYQYTSWDKWEEEPPIITRTSSSAKGIGINIPRAKNWAGVSVRNRSGGRINSQIYSISDKDKSIFRISINQNNINRESKDIEDDARWVGISVTDDQQIYAVDQHNNRVMRLAAWNTRIRNAQYKSLPTNERTQWYGPSVDGNHIYFVNSSLNQIARYPAWADWDDDTVPEYKNIIPASVSVQHAYKGISVQDGKIYLVDNHNDSLVIYNDWNANEPSAVRSLPSGGWHGIAIGNEETDTITYNNWAGLSIITRIDTTTMTPEDSPIIVVAECDTKRIGVYENWDDTTMFHDPSLIIDRNKHRISLGDRYDSYFNNELYVLDNANNRVLRYGLQEDPTSPGDFLVGTLLGGPPETMQLGINADWQGISIFRGQIYVLDNSNKRVVCYKSFADNVNPVFIEPESQFRSLGDKQKWQISELAGLSKLKKYLYTVDNISNSFIRFPISN